MGYIVEKSLVCDGCGFRIRNLYRNKKYGERYYQLWAEGNGWKVDKTVWLCPECCKKAAELKTEKGI